MFSSSLYRFRLWDGVWETVQPTGGKPPATAGHSMIYHAPSKTLLVYGGHRPTTARYNNTTYHYIAQADYIVQADYIAHTHTWIHIYQIYTHLRDGLYCKLYYHTDLYIKLHIYLNVSTYMHTTA